MDFNDKEYSIRLCSFLNSIGVYPQLDNSIAISEKTPVENMESAYILKFDSLTEAIKFLKNNLEVLLNSFASVWDLLEEDLAKEQPDSEKPNSISDNLLLSFIDSLIETASGYKGLSDNVEKLTSLLEDHKSINNIIRKQIGYYSTLTEYLDAELIQENKRILILENMIEELTESKINKMLRTAQYGMDEGLGPRGRNSLWHPNTITPYGNYDQSFDRVMDGRNIGEGKGEATEKFTGPNGYNKFKRRPDLLLKKKQRYRSKPLMSLDRKLKRRRKKEKRKAGYSIKSNGLVYVENYDDPTYLYWWETNNNPFSWKDRSTHSPYPSWDSYKTR